MKKRVQRRPSKRNAATTKPLPVSVQPPSIVPMDLNDCAKALLYKACTSALHEIRVSALDKGLSGATVWLTTWDIQRGITSAPHVMKIGEYEKLHSESQRVANLVAPVLPSVGHIQLFGPQADKDNPGAKLGLLRQEFIEHAGHPLSLKTWLSEDVHALYATDAVAALRLVREKFRELYTKKMKNWGSKERKDETTTLRTELARRLEKSSEPLGGIRASIGAQGLDDSLQRHSLPTWEQVLHTVESVLDGEEKLPYCLTHGDLHAQNVLIDDGDGFHLIDFAWAGFGWKAVDFLMLECSLKFLVMPAEAEVRDLLGAEELLDLHSSRLATYDFAELSNNLCGASLRIITTAVAEIRHLAQELEAVSDLEQYRRGLLGMTAGICGIPGLHRPYLTHSLAFHAAKLQQMSLGGVLI